MSCRVQSVDSPTTVLCPVLISPRIPRPPNAFMLYANEHRKTLAHLYPADSNKEISRRLGQTWKDLNLQEKNKYFQKAKDIDQEHKRKYPGYVYNPKDARMRKAIRSTLKNKPPYLRPTNGADLYQNLIMNENANVLQMPFGAIESTEEEQRLYEKEKPSLEAAEKYTKVGKYEEQFAKSGYLPISTTKFIRDPELFTNNAEYHKEYIIKYFNHIPDYETYNVTTEDGVTFPYVTIPNLIMRQDVPYA